MFEKYVQYQIETIQVYNNLSKQLTLYFWNFCFVTVAAEKTKTSLSPPVDP